jgi:hypothetical protein
VTWTLARNARLHLVTDAGTGSGVAGESLPGAPLLAERAVRVALEASGG